MFTKKFIIIMLAVIGVLIVFIAALLIWKNSSGPRSGTNVKTSPADKIDMTLEESIEAGKEETKDLIKNPGPMAKTVMVGTSSAVVVVPGTNPVSVESGEVLARTGDVAKTNSLPGENDSISSSFEVDTNSLGDSTLKLQINSTSITPKEFIVHPGQVISLAVVNLTNRSELLIFEDASLSSVAVSLKPNKTKTITFNVPMKVGEYVFYSDVPIERAMGVQGKMIVQ